MSYGVCMAALLSYSSVRLLLLIGIFIISSSAL